ncbi:hypothetical protein [Propionicicella superfundia]|uniref:hypothetical protein n=1 Tax=Propionicicella superfundia TaxID=348582 RepID=UPI00041715E6|nr:hypothetical protein [Propionicicella superfundia]
MIPLAGDDRPLPVEVADPVTLRRFSIKPHHLDAYLELLPRHVDVRARAGWTTHRLLLETQAEPKLTWVASHPTPVLGDRAVRADPATSDLDALTAPHVFRNEVVRPVRVERLTHATPESVRGRIAILRRYAITNEWGGFLDIWRRIADVRDAYGFRCLFAVADEPKDMFTWSFDFAGDFADFPAAQREYYHDPARIALRGVFDYMADYAITPAEQLDTTGRRFAAC